MEKYKKLIEETLKNYFFEYSKNSEYSEVIWRSMEYTTLLSAKRLRSILALDIAQNLNLDINTALPMAASIELMHAYSLIHDDLPCMDNDDLRRGKPTNHKVFGEDIATLAGDSLISFGAQVIIDKTPKEIPSHIVLDIVRDYLITSGALGIVAGQAADIKAQDENIDTEKLKYIHKYKTGKLFEYSFVSIAKLAQKEKEYLEKLSGFSLQFGQLFQIYDDIIDCTLDTEALGKTAHKDEKTNKLTYVRAYGLGEAKNIFYGTLDENYAILKELNLNSQIFDKVYTSLKEKVGK